LDKNSFIKNIFDNRIVQSRIIYTFNKELELIQKERIECFFYEKNVKTRTTIRKGIIKEMLDNFDGLDNF